MATIIPSDWRALAVTGSAAREIETLELLARQLPAHLTVLHGVHWTRIERGTAVIGEIDFVVLAPSGRVLLIEQKSGFLDEGETGLTKRYAGVVKNVPRQLQRTVDALLQRLAPITHGESLTLDTLLYCPDYTLKSPGTAGLPVERIVDLTRRDRLAQIIGAALPADEPARPELARRLQRFFEDTLELTPDVSALVGRGGELVTRLAGGLATWARRLEFAPFRLRVIGTAGSGKTQLAFGVLRDAAAAGRRALYVCYNRPLADHLAQRAPPGVEVATFHQLCDRRLRAAGQRVAFDTADAFEQMARDFAALAPAAAERVDELVIDEGQDFEQAWVAPLLARLAPAGRAWWLEDPLQNLYDRPAVELPGWTVLRAETNFRSPRDLVALLNVLVAPQPPFRSASPFGESGVEYLDYADTAGLLDATKRAVTLALQAGFRKHDIALVTLQGRGRSRLLPYDRLGPHRLTRFSGAYDLFGNPQYQDGDLLLETVYRFKGQSAPCVVLTEVDFEVLDELARRKLFVGVTRASMRLYVVLSQRAARLLLEVADGVRVAPAAVPEA